jgi:NAD(P)-dependent dehydrogenase (short-subunit alcohol dehydrogenase family)
MAKLSGKIAVVTGATGALGRVVTEHLLREGAIVIASRTTKSGSVSAAIKNTEHDSNLTYFELDASSEKSVCEFYANIAQRYPKVDILCNLVGGVQTKKFIEDISLSEWEEIVQLNLTSCFLMMREVLPSMKEHRFGRIINIAAKPAITPEPKRGGYGVAKSGVITLTKTAAEEVKQFGDITVNAIAPSIIVTEANKEWGTQEEIKKWVTPEQIAEMIIHLCTDDGSAINGHIIQMYGKV